MSDHLAEDYRKKSEDTLVIDEQDAKCYACNTGTCKGCPDYIPHEDDPKEDR